METPPLVKTCLWNSTSLGDGAAIVLVSGASTFMTGQELLGDGGFSCGLFKQ